MELTLMIYIYYTVIIILYRYNNYELYVDLYVYLGIYVEEYLCHDKADLQEEVGGREERNNQKTQTNKSDPTVTFWRAPPNQRGKREGE